MYDQIYAYTDIILSKAQCGFRKGYSTQYSIIAMIEKWGTIWIKVAYVEHYLQI